MIMIMIMIMIRPDDSRATGSSRSMAAQAPSISPERADNFKDKDEEA